MTILQAVQTIVAAMQPEAPQFFHEKRQMANVFLDNPASTKKPVIIYVADYSGEIGGENMVQESQSFVVEFLYHVTLEDSELLTTAAIRAKAKELAIQFYKRLVMSDLFEYPGTAIYSMVNENLYDANYIGIALEFRNAKMQPGTCYTPYWTGSMTVTPSAAQSLTEAGGSVAYAVTSNTILTITCPESWVSISPGTGFEDEAVVVTVAENTTGVARSATITFAGTGVTSATRIINQSA